MFKLGFLGLGKMGSAILDGVLKVRIYKNYMVDFYAPSKDTQEKYKSIGLTLAKDERDLFVSSSIIILAVKPQKYDEVFAKLDGIDFSNKIIISLAPGKSISCLKNAFKNARIVRAMPNTAASINKAVTTIAYENNEEIKEVYEIFACIGSCVIVKEERQIDELIPVNGSMPAYLFEFIKAFIECACEYGIDEETAKKLVVETIMGSCELLLSSKENIDILIDNVCSKGGTTIAGLDELRNNNFRESIKACYKACIEKASTLR